jgi:hypothetical protein
MNLVFVQYENRDGVRAHAPPSKLHQDHFKLFPKLPIYTCEHLVTNKLQDFHDTKFTTVFYDETKN